MINIKGKTLLNFVKQKNRYITVIIMNKSYYAVKLLPSRPDFAQTMSEEENTIMNNHAMYWMEHMNKGMVHAFGPVFDPEGAYGLGIISVDSEKQLTDFVANDPASSITRIVYHPMMAVVPGASTMGQP